MEQHLCRAVRIHSFPRLFFPFHSVRFTGAKHRTHQRRTKCNGLNREQEKPGLQEEKDPLEKQRNQTAEDELKDPSNFIEYLIPRPLRLTLLGGGAMSCCIASVISGSQLARDVYYQSDPEFGTVLINVAGLFLFASLFLWDQSAAATRLDRREKVRKAQLRIGDRELFTNDSGERMSRLKDVDDDWILRRLERWGKRENMPFIGPKKGAILQGLVKDQQPNLAVEVGSMAGYSALTIAQALSPGARIISIESDLLWALAAKRFAWQGLQGEKRSQAGERRQASIDIWWGKAQNLLAGKFEGGPKIELLFLDGLPSQYLDYLKAAEPNLAPGALVIADNAGVFSQGGLKPYLEYVRSSSKYESRFIECPLEWRDDVSDGLEVSTFKGLTL